LEFQNMEDRFPDWTAQLRRDGVGPEDMPAITRGLSQAVTLALTGDYSGDTFTMALKASPDADDALATFTCTTGGFVSGVTPVTLTLGANAQGSLPLDTDGNGIEAPLYDIICDPATGAAYRILGGYQPISGGVT
jgi:hypothetical protein